MISGFEMGAPTLKTAIKHKQREQHGSQSIVESMRDHKRYDAFAPRQKQIETQ